MVNKKVQRIKFIIAVLVVICVAIGIFIRIKIYNENGEKNMPYTLSKIIVVSTASKYEKEGGETVPSTDTTWNFDIVQNNDVYIEISNNTKYNEKIKNVTLENIQIVEPPKVGNMKFFMPNSLDGARYTYTDEYLVTNSLTYRGADESSYKNLQVNRNGGKLGISFTNKDLQQYTSGEDTEVTYDGRMLLKQGLTDADVKSKVAFDLTIELDDERKYWGRVELDLNCEGLIENGISQKEITDFSNIIFKRI